MDFKVYIEIPTGSSIKYEVDEETGELKVDRFMFTSFTYPSNYGYIANTKGQDGDPLDVLVLALHPVMPGVSVKCHAIGLMEMEDEEGIDTKIIAVPDNKIDPEFGLMEEITDVPDTTKSKIRHFFERYKDLESDKWVKIKDFKGRKEAEVLIEKSRLS